MKLKTLSAIALVTIFAVPAIAIAQSRNTTQNRVQNLSQDRVQDTTQSSTLNQNVIAQASIADLQRANLTTLSGSVVSIHGEDFILSDGTGQILVEAESRPIRQARLNPGDRVTVAGQYDDDNSFEAHSITPSSGTAIYVFDD